MDSFSTYLDHLILLLAARFQAPLEVSTEELLTPVNGSAVTDPWELVSRTVQLNLCSPQTEQERLYTRQLDVHNFSAAVCRERARYVQWKLSADQKRSRDERCSTQISTPAVPSASAAPVTTLAAASAKSAVAVGGNASTFDVTRDSLQRDVSALYALVRQSLPSALDDDTADVESDEENGQATATASAIPVASTTTTTTTAAPSPFAAQVHEVVVRTAEERHRDEQAARARDEFLSQIQALQSVYFNKYRRWLEVPENVLDPPSPLQRAAATSSAISSRQSSVSVRGSEAAAAAATIAARRSVNGVGSFNKHCEENERADLLEALKLTRPERPAPRPVPSASPPAFNVRAGVHPTIAAMRRQVQLQRPLRPSAVSAGVEDGGDRTSADSQEMRQSSGYTGAPAKTLMRPAVSSVATDGASAERGAAGTKQAAMRMSAAPKDTAPPASRRGRWQIVEYDDEGEEDE
ncbi:hypothetical protein ABB37_04990 [Leptomonas pyrrhocoris]|uniref:Uncharacterized protein n=1 Tax=Leptomonas pyrrhocoris TaxID=157538 RepID=A0A0M9G0X9_LEPPY|nr:hypothetical protein ABB37_04990 [Leptomonas pyrrhocoris]XP_015658378.1 hypothetical protein ABB37_04990 [Leptomonas pyrrhocoris]KPA79938.1 hypothetical protein ABB37_04990 [Leptomonas pyrrhocoris]KPA79939.1 hypothetical protein ABB37_04990 [Leptomonas pyrrhocoris]|eukprot:XP_015658377.1 hypothetical protein ABB37_04990 [Leptomonas pyrrhocoris]